MQEELLPDNEDFLLFDDDEFETSPSISPFPSSVATDDNESSSQLFKSRKAKKRLYYRKFRPFSIIPRNDVRKVFPLAWMNVWNSSDPLLYLDCLKYYTSSHCINRNEEIVSEITNVLPYIVPDSSLEMSYMHYAFVHAISNDAVGKLISCQIVRSRSSLISKVLMKIHLRGTKSFDIALPQENTKESTSNSCHNDRESCIAKSSSSLDAALVSSLHNYRVLTRCPVVMDAVGTLTAEINEMTGQVIMLSYRCEMFGVTPCTL